MRSVSVEIQLTCRGCQQPVACNAVLPQVSCDRCGRVASIDARVWKLVLHEAVTQGPRLDAGRERTAALTTDAGSFQVVYRGSSPACLACRATIAPERAQEAIPAYVYQCTCGMRAASRALAPEVGLPAVQLLLQEDPELLWPPQRTEAVALKCNGCGGTQTVGATTPRIFACTFCSVQVYVPDDLWSLLHPVRAVKPFVLGIEDAAGEAPDAKGPQKKQGGRDGAGRGGKQAPDPTRIPRFDDVHDILVGGDGTLFAVLVLSDSGEPELFALDPEGRVRWRKELPKKHRSGARLAWMVSGHVCLWAEGQRALFGIAATDGATVAELGSDKSGAGVDRIDLRKAACLACDVDGSILVGKQESGGVRFLRFASSGAPIALWPGMPVPTPWSEDEYPPTLEEAPDRLVGAQDVIFRVGWDGLLHVAGDQAVTSFDRSGKKLMVCRDAECGVSTGGPSYGSVHADASGIVYTFESGPLVRRYERGRGKPYLHAEDQAGLLRTESVASVGPDGTVWVAGPEGALRRFGPRRTLEWASAGARKSDREAAESD